MFDKKNLKEITPFLWEIPSSYQATMHVPARVYATAAMLDQVFNDRSLDQLANVAALPGIQEYALAMPDAHQGYGFPIGGVAATLYPHGAISPGGIGYDINCGVRLLSSDLSYEEIKAQLSSLARELYSWVPSGVGKGGKLVLEESQLDEVLNRGVPWMIEQGYAIPDDLGCIESGGHLSNANAEYVSVQAKKRGFDQLGTIGAGNHFVEVDYVENIFDEKIAHAFGLRKHQVVVLIHTGSRGLGHQVATDYIRRMMAVMPEYGISVPDPELVCVPFNSKEGQEYFSAMAAAANFAWCNRQMITWEIRQAWKREFGKEHGLQLVYDVAHNIAKVETHVVQGIEKKLIVHRKGATRAFGPHNAELATQFQATGQPVLIPGSMGTASYVLAGTAQGMQQAFGSCCHGAGRQMSRQAAKKAIIGSDVRQNLLAEGIHIQTGSVSGLAEEAPAAYKNIDEVVRVVHDAGIAQLVARLRPCAVIKG